MLLIIIVVIVIVKTLLIIIVYYATQAAHRTYTHNIKTVRHKKDKLLRLKMTTNELYAENISVCFTTHLLLCTIIIVYYSTRAA